MQRQTSTTRPRGRSGTRLHMMQFVVVGFAILTMATAMQLRRQVENTHAATLRQSEQWAALFAQTRGLHSRIFEIDSILTTSEREGRFARSELLSRAVARARIQLQATRNIVKQTPSATDQLTSLSSVDQDVAMLLAASQRFSELVQQGDWPAVTRVTNEMIQHADEAQARVDLINDQLHARQAAELREQQNIAAAFARREWIIVFLIAATLLLMAALGLGMARAELVAGQEREELITELQARETALRELISEREAALQSARQQHTLLNQAERIAHIGSWYQNLATGESKSSDELTRIFDVDPCSPVTRDIYMSRIHPEDRSRVETALDAAIRERTAFRIEYRIVRTDGAVRTVYSEGTFENPAGETVVTVVVQDITDRRAVEKMKDEFISTVSHELRTPLTSIRGSLGLLASGKLGSLSDNGQRMLEIASANTDRLVRLINDILDVERMESGKVNLVKSPCNAAEVVRHAVDAVRSLAEREGMTIEVDAEPVSLVADSDRLVQVLTNLLGNAVKFSPAGSTTRVGARQHHRSVVFSVADQGRGIPADKVDSIFERFGQVDASDSREKGGSGLGLPICRSIVHHHGGNISVESESGRGSTFTFTIPGAEAPPSEDAPLVPGKRTVFICDDDADTRTVLGQYLANRGYNVRSMSSGHDLLAAAALEPPDMILLDLFMPEINGWETFARLRSNPATAQIPVVIASVLSQEETGAPTGELSGWLKKPFDEEALATALGGAFHDRRTPRLMLVEDDRDLARVIATSFERHGIEIIHASDGQQAIEIAKTARPDLIVLDLILPGIDGFGVVDWLKDHDLWRSVPMVVYSAIEPTPSQRDRLRLGPTEFFIKSRISPEEFENRVMALLDALMTQNEGVTVG